MTQIKLILAVFGDLLDPNLFSKIAKLQPTSFWLKGDIIPHRSNLTRKETCWEYSSGFVTTLYLDDLTKSFLQKFATDTKAISNYIEKNKLETKIDVVVKIFNDQIPALSFNKDFMDLVVKMNGNIDIDLYYIAPSSRQ